MKIGILKEGKVPPDSRVPLTPAQCVQLQEEHPVEIVVQPSPGRCYPDQEYQEAGIPLTDDLVDCDVLLGVKEVPIGCLPEQKTCFFFSHTIKKQSYNRDLLRAILKNRIRLIDYEVLVDEHGQRLVAFGRFAGMVGAHNAMWVWGQRCGGFQLDRMYQLHDYEAAKQQYARLPIPPVKVVLTGTGRVANGARQTLLDMGLRQVSPDQFLVQPGNDAVFTQLDCEDYVKPDDDRAFCLEEFFARPDRFVSTFQPYQETADVMINGIYWDDRAPAFFSADAMRLPSFSIQVIGDITCDIAPESSIPSTLRPTTIAEPVFGYDPHSGTETDPFLARCIDMMTVDNLPNELPRDASRSFGEQLVNHILPELLEAHSDILDRATVAVDGQLGRDFEYLSDYVS